MKQPTETSTTEKPARKLTLEQFHAEWVAAGKPKLDRPKWMWNGVDVLDPKTTDEQRREAIHEAVKATVKLPASDKNSL